MTEVVDSVRTTGDSPFRFLEPYNLAETSDLIGREDEGDMLLALLKWKDIVVVYGKSGVGKTSFVNHALGVRDRVEWLPIRVTRQLDINKSLQEALANGLLAETAQDIHNDRFETHAERRPAGNSSVVQMVKDLNLKWNRPIYLIVDQIEELFLIGGDQERKDFIKTLGGLVAETALQKKIILILREEHLGFIQYIEPILNGVLQDALRLEDIDNKFADAIYRRLIGLLPDEEFEPDSLRNHLASDAIKRELLKRCWYTDKFLVSRFRAQRIQILLFLVWDKWNKGEFHKETQGKVDVKARLAAYVEKIGQATHPLKEYLYEAVDIDLGKSARLLRARYWHVLRKAISAANTKQPINATEIYNKLLDELIVSAKPNEDGDPRVEFYVNQEDVIEWCDKLVERSLLESIKKKESKSDRWFQLRHDILVPSIRELDPNLEMRFPRIVKADKQVKNPYVGLSQYDPEAKQDHENEDERSSSFGSFGGGFGVAISESEPVQEISKRLYGRRQVVEEYIEFLGSEPCLVIVGDSGTGKSSLVKGGILPELKKRGYHTRTLAPGADIGKFREEIEKFVSEVAENKSTYSCLYIDQFEEVYTFRDYSQTEKNNFNTFLSFLNGLIKPGGTFKLIASIRHEFAHEFDRNFSEQAQRNGQTTDKKADWLRYKKLLKYPSADEVFEIVVGPAYDQGVDFKPYNLPELIAADAMNTSYFLPLLSFTMRTLYKREVVDQLVGKRDLFSGRDRNDKPSLSLSETGYDELGGIINCLQNEFTTAYNNLKTDEQEIFPELMARMTVFKDSVAKARPLPISSIKYKKRNKTNIARAALRKFPQFLRLRTLEIDGKSEECYEPIHDSLLLYCSEIRAIVNAEPKDGSQTKILPVLDSMMREWKGSDYQYSEANLQKVVFERHAQLSSIFHLVENGEESSDWLFVKEFELVTACRTFFKSIYKTKEEEAREETLKTLEMEREQARLRQLYADSQLETSKKTQDALELQKTEAETQAALAKERLKQRYYWFFLLIGVIVILVLLVKYYYDSSKISEAEAILGKFRTDQLTIAFEDSSRVAEVRRLAQLEAQAAEQREREARNEAEEKTRQLVISQAKLRELVRKLALEGSRKDDAIAATAAAMRQLQDTTYQLLKAKFKLDSLKDARVLGIARRNQVASPAFSYRVAEKAKLSKANNIAAVSILEALNSKPQYFESMIRQHVHDVVVSRDGNRILTVELHQEDISKHIIGLWDTNGLPIVPRFEVSGEIRRTEFSFDGSKVLIETPGRIDVYDISSRTSSSVIVKNITYSGFSENQDRMYVITNNAVLVYSTGNSALNQTSRNTFEGGTGILNAKFYNNSISIVTPKGVGLIRTYKSGKGSIRPLTLSFVLNDGVKVLAIQKLIGVPRRLILMDTTRKVKWGKRLPERDYNVVTSFVNSRDGNHGLIQFNKKRIDFIKYFLQGLNGPLESSADTVPILVDDYSPDDLYLLDFVKREMVPVFNEGLTNNKFILTAACDSVLTFDGGSIVRFPLLKVHTRNGAKSNISIGEETRFKKVLLAGAKGYLIVSLDENNQMKLWRYGEADVLAKNGLLWCPSDTELNNLLIPD